MVSVRSILIGLAATVALTACTDWDTGVHGQVAVSNGARPVEDVDHTGLVWWETVGTGSVDAGSDLAADDLATEDATAADDSSTAADAGNTEDAGTTADAGNTEDAAAGDAALLDTLTGLDTVTALDAATGLDTTKTDTSLADVPLADSAAVDVLDPCAGNSKPLGCACTSSQSCASGLCV